MSHPAPLSSLRIRPRFEERLPAAPAIAHETLVRGLARRSRGLVVKPFPGFIGIHVADGERKCWSPRLFLSIEAAPDGGTRLEGIYGPEIEIWSVFLYGYLATGLLGTFSGILGTCQHLLGQRPWGLWVCAAMAIGALALYLFAQLGQKLGAGQTVALHQAYTAAVIELRDPS